jgi:hypothetical protein
MGVLGALVASRVPGNSIGWLMCANSLAGSLLFLPLDYGYAALVATHSSWPLSQVALWIGSWAWVPSLGLFFPLILAWFPDGRVPHRWRVVDWLAVSGTMVLGISIFLASSSVTRRFMPIGPATFTTLAPWVENPLGRLLPEGWLDALRYLGLALILLAYVAAVASLVNRFRSARGDERLQLTWLAYAGVLIAVVLVFGIGAVIASEGPDAIVRGQAFGDAFVPLSYAAFALPLAITIAILRYRLYDIDLLINRTLVYVSLTAILYAVYVAVTTFMQRLVISISGQKSDAAYVLAAFVVAGAFSPVKDWLQRVVNRRLGGATSSAALDQFSARVEAVVAVMDMHSIASQLVDQAASAFAARGASVFLSAGNSPGPFYSCDRLDGDAAVEVDLRHDGRQVGRLLLGSRRGGVAYTKRDLASLQRSADAVGKALALADLPPGARESGPRPARSLDAGSSV